ncbi:SDR family NAD(P)-dependent oxidoreductase [Lysobacter sp. TY2-98]|uniref:SDR family NAD(P)-dependent oxidoreductase n=1 Tax=Lysobacter sp. TY2-98 TaxID=2290922 RepID=UPI000E208BA7|nr:SDR family NAD(P)-dependent oxidoreductase [Lysobacter sp. TY2-98]AXK72080.1 SDR family NAD(P)-dependent oxidoreductase [Lysobacter sp. TY2-98]
MPARTVVITGASSGFGRGVALRLAGQGCNLVLAARRGHLLDQLAKECGNAIAVTCDVGDPNAVEKLAAAAIAKFNRFDVWINNAGVAALGAFERIPLEDHMRVMKTNLGGAMAGSYVALRHFRQAGGGVLINVASMLGRTPAPYYASYCATKYGIVGLCDALRQEVAAANAKDIRICAVLPMAADTPFFDHAANYTGHTLHPFPITDADEIVEAIVGVVNAPQDEVTVGLSATAATIAERLSQTITHGMTGAVQQLLQDEAPEAPQEAGNLHRPIAIGTGVHGSILQRLEVERARPRH